MSCIFILTIKELTFALNYIVVKIIETSDEKHYYFSFESAFNIQQSIDLKTFSILIQISF